MSELDDLRLLHIDVDTVFVMSSSNRIERVNDPEHSIAPRLLFAGCPQGNIVRVSHDLEEQVAARLLAIAAQETPWWNPWALPQCIESCSMFCLTMRHRQRVQLREYL